VSIRKIRGSAGLGLLDIGLGRVGSRNLDPCNIALTAGFKSKLDNILHDHFPTAVTSVSYRSFFSITYIVSISPYAFMTIFELRS